MINDTFEREQESTLEEIINTYGIKPIEIENPHPYDLNNESAVMVKIGDFFDSHPEVREKFLSYNTHNETDRINNKNQGLLELVPTLLDGELYPRRALFLKIGDKYRIEIFEFKKDYDDIRDTLSVQASLDLSKEITTASEDLKRLDTLKAQIEQIAKTISQ